MTEGTKSFDICVERKTKAILLNFPEFASRTIYAKRKRQLHVKEYHEHLEHSTSFGCNSGTKSRRISTTWDLDQLDMK